MDRNGMNVGRKVTKGMKVIPENSRRPHFVKAPVVSGSSAIGSRPEDQIARKAEGRQCGRMARKGKRLGQSHRSDH